MKRFYLTNYKAIHHLATLSFFIAMLVFLGCEKIFESFSFLLIIMLANYYIVKTCLSYSGLDEEIERQLKEMEEKKEE